MLNHAGCILKKANQIKSSDEVEGLDLLRWEDQQKIRKYVEGEISSAATASNVESTIEVSQTSRAMCKHCGEKIMKGTILNGLELYFDDVLRDLAFMLSDPMMTVIKACFSKHSQWPPESFRLAGLESCCWFIIPWMSET
ncbi:Poly [ADP-ribose] polymerase 1 [Apostasia shenzhenica]|uniref:Poly [ADP-ribose] polymerase 1 n=1 Tax=Apostasia shenzhenica TaxID=1088818 RepID=A0A2I0ANK7_9ASPA|nr:Poly [ADP-ribose] polymerase 1 [Apostasia shenzhenica]